MKKWGAQNDPAGKELAERLRGAGFLMITKKKSVCDKVVIIC